MSRSILHVDMDAFFAAVEQRDHPEWRGKPVLVGGDPNARGVVSAASYEARRFGCHSAMPMAQALRLCPHAVVVSGMHARYGEVSREMFEILERFTPAVEPLSIDEAFLDVTGSTRLFGSAADIARQIRVRIRDELRLTASVGVAPNKFLAKLASDLSKPDALTIVPPDDVEGFLRQLPIERLWGAGKATLARFEMLRVRTFGDALKLSEATLRREFGAVGEHFFLLLRGVDERPVVSDGEAKSISHEVTFPRDVEDLDHVRSVLLTLLEHVAHRLRRHERLAQTVMIKVREPDFSTLTRRATLSSATDNTDELWRAVSELYERWRREHATPVRLIGVGVTGLTSRSGRQLELFGEPQRAKQRRLDDAVDKIRDRFGPDAIRRGGGREE